MESWGVVKLLRALFGKWCFCIDYEDVGTGLSGITGKRVCITHTKQGPSLSDLLCFSASLLEIILQDNGSISTYLTGYLIPSPHSLKLKVVVGGYGCLQVTSGSQGFLRTDFVEYCVTEFTKSEWNSSHSARLLCLPI